MDEPTRWFNQTILARAAKALRKNGFTVVETQNKEAAKTRTLDLIPAGALISVGGSTTIRELGLVEELEKRGHRLSHSWKPNLSPEQKSEIRREGLTADVYLSSSNAITYQGELVNIDQYANRTNAMTFGPKKVIIVAGYNKLVENVDAALWRVQNVAAPKNARRLGRKLPCSELGICTDCDSPERMCAVASIIYRKPTATDITIVLVAEELGY